MPMGCEARRLHRNAIGRLAHLGDQEDGCMWTHNVLRGAVAALGMLAVLAHAGQADKGAQPALSKDDSNFIMEAAQGGMKEVQMGKIAQQQAQSAEVKQFGKRLEDDHARANQQLTAIAQKHGVNVPASLDKKHQAEVDKFSKMKARDFDRQFSKNMVDDHEKDIRKFRRQAEKGQNAELKQFASQSLPVLEEHLKLARNLAGTGAKPADKGAPKGASSSK
jgi:putative membrane protein